MWSEMKPQFYTSRAHYELEQEKIFQKLWIFAGLKSFVREPDQFMTLEVGGLPIVIQNFDGELRAFVNSCAHRLAKIQNEDFGRRPLSCPYHGWKYDAEGKTSFIPMEKKYYKMTDCVRSELGLRKVHIREIGQILFVNIAENPLPIQRQFPPQTLLDLKNFSQNLESEFATTKIHARYNWKLPFENLKDGLHVFFVHPQSLSPDVSFPSNEAPFSNNDLSHRLKSLSYGGAEGESSAALQGRFQGLTENWGEDGKYYNWLLYPNTHIASVDGGRSFIFEQYHPVAHDQTVLTVHWITAKKKKDYPSKAALFDFAKWHQPILAEDTRIMEIAQAGINPQSPRGCRGVYEQEVVRMELWYQNYLNGIESL